MKRRLLFIVLTSLCLTGCGRDDYMKSLARKQIEALNAENSSEQADSGEKSDLNAASVSASSVAESTKETASAGEADTEPTQEPTPEVTPEPTEEPVDTTPVPVYFDESWEFAQNSMIHTGNAVLYKAGENRKDIVIGVNAGHGCEGGSSVYTYCHPDQTPKVTGGSTAAGSVQATACAVGMTFFDGTPERDVNLAEAQVLKQMLLENGYDVLMIREGEDVQLDNIARTLICNAYADCHIAIHWDGDGLDYDKGAYYMSVPEALKTMYPVSETWERSNQLGDCLISGLSGQGCAIFDYGSMPVDLTQTSYSTVPSIDIELGNAASDHSQPVLENLAAGLTAGIDLFFQ
ncbi:MAG: N-acetylmuramoyl-L-alanine amidase [Lachnospiraceae bacterium]|nr:N-acetylmuramoyl-L-alanine amidase [Lachnospiraceae bacterium]